MILFRKKQLKRSKRDKIIAGVLGGVGELLEVDPTIVRIVWLIIMAITGFVPGMIVYFLAVYYLPVSNK